jgi:DNA gyrase inhibitor GyrI
MPKFSIAKSIVINDSPENVFKTARDFKKWPIWSPWLIAEPDCEVNYSADGTSYNWDGRIVGSGEMTVTGEEASKSIDYQLMFLKPWKSESQVRLLFKPTDKGTEVTWTMDGSLPFFMFWMKKSMIAMIGMDYDRGLKMLKAVVETGANPSKLEFHGEGSQPACHYVGVSTECTISEIGPQVGRDFRKLMDWLKETHTEPSGPPFTIDHRFDMVTQITQYTACFPVESPPSSPPEGFVSGERPQSPTYAIKHTGPYHFLGNAWASGMFRARSKVFAQNKKIDPFEIYENNPEETPENELITVVHFPTK